MKREDKRIAESAEAEAQAQLTIVQILGKVDRARRERIVQAVGHLIAAEELVPGVFARILTPRPSDAPEGLAK